MWPIAGAAAEQFASWCSIHGIFGGRRLPVAPFIAWVRTEFIFSSSLTLFTRSPYVLQEIVWCALVTLSSSYCRPLQSLRRQKALLHRLCLELELANSKNGQAIFLSMHGLTSLEVTRDIHNVMRLNVISDVTDDISSFLLKLGRWNPQLIHGPPSSRKKWKRLSCFLHGEASFCNL